MSRALRLFGLTFLVWLFANWFAHVGEEGFEWNLRQTNHVVGMIMVAWFGGLVVTALWPKSTDPDASRSQRERIPEPTWANDYQARKY